MNFGGRSSLGIDLLHVQLRILNSLLACKIATSDLRDQFIATEIENLSLPLLTCTIIDFKLPLLQNKIQIDFGESRVLYLVPYDTTLLDAGCSVCSRSSEHVSTVPVCCSSFQIVVLFLFGEQPTSYHEFQTIETCALLSIDLSRSSRLF